MADEVAEPVIDEPRDALRELGTAYGIDVEYWDWCGRSQHVAADTLRAVLSAFDVDASTPSACDLALAEHRRARAAQLLPPCIVLRSGRKHAVSTGVSVPARAWVELEDGGTRELPDVQRDGEIEVPVDLPTGYHRLVVDTPHRAATHLVVTPDQLLLPAGFDTPGWGLAVQLYSVRSADSWGVGDLADLSELARWSAGKHGADFVLVNPLHAAEAVPPMNPSPYSPTTRRFSNPIYLHVEDVPEYAVLPPAARADVDRLGEALRAQRSTDELIDRDAAWAAKHAALQLLYDYGLSAQRSAAFATYCAGEGAELQRFATWCVLSELHGADWREWPAQLHDPQHPAVATAVEAYGMRVDFYRWLQWQLDEQLGLADNKACTAGMRIGVIHDVAVGVSLDGADSWAWQDVMAANLTVGAPPDAYSQRGQDWQQPPWRPDRLAELGYAPLRELFRSALRHCGGLRVDHIIGLFRLWWIPAGTSADAGTYVHYDHDALLGILALEAARAGAIIIGEDLGNVEPWVQDYLRERGLFGTSILWFETDRRTGAPLAPERWRAQCLASVTTHDLPPTTGYLAGDHIRLRDSLGLLTRSMDEELTVGHAEKNAWLAELTRCGLLPATGRTSGEPGETEIVAALHTFLTRTPALLRGVALTDAVGERRTQNQPGTRAEYPNWRIPLGGAAGSDVLLGDIFADPAVAEALEAIRPAAERR